MGYYLPITDYAGQQYRRRVDDATKSPYHIERKYRIFLAAIKEDDQPSRQLLHEYARKQKKKKDRKNKQRFSIEKGLVKGKGEHINVQV